MSETERIIQEAVIETARRPASRRGPFVFNEAQLQEDARVAKARLEGGKRG